MVSSQSDCNIVDNISGKYVLNWTFHFKVSWSWLTKKNLPQVQINLKYMLRMLKSVLDPA